MLQCYISPTEGGDPAVYGSGSKKARNGETKEPETRSDEIDANSDVSDDDDDDDSTLLTAPPGFNRLLIVLRDVKVPRFVKYITAAATGSRWDVSGEFQVDALAETSGSDPEG